MLFRSFTIGTRWAPHDLYDWIMRHDHTVDFVVRSVVEDGRIIFPEVFTREVIDQKRKLFGSLFPLLYMNSAADPELVDFDLSNLRGFEMVGKDIQFEEGDADRRLSRDFQAPVESPPEYAGMTYTEMLKAAKQAGRDELDSIRAGRVMSS